MSKMTDEELGRKILAPAAILWREQEQGVGFNYEYVGRLARELLAAEAPELPPICGMSVDEIAEEIDEGRGRQDASRYNWVELSARVAHRLAQPVPKIAREAAKAKRLCWIWHKVTNPKITEEAAWNFYTTEGHDTWRAVAEAKGGGE